jgi:mono/diheme cytochrome c family protein
MRPRGGRAALALCAVLLARAWLADGAEAPQAAHATAVPDPSFEQWCAPCHRSGLYMAGTLALQRKYQGTKPALLEARTDLTVETVRSVVRHGANSMAPFRKTEISDAELDALAKYLARQ